MLGEVQALPISTKRIHYGYSSSYVALYWLTSGQVIYKWPISSRVHAVAESPGTFYMYVVVPAGYNFITI